MRGNSIRRMAGALAVPAFVLLLGTAAGAQSRFQERIDFIGFNCPSAPQDSVFDQDAELAISVMVLEGGTGAVRQQVQIPGGGRSFTGVMRDSARYHRQTVWQGKAQTLWVHVTLLEIDGVGQVKGMLGRAGGVVSRNMGTPAPGHTEAVSDMISRALSAELGANHLGHYIMQVNDDEGYGEWWKSQKQGRRYSIEGTNGKIVNYSFDYHFESRHGLNGADCHAYFTYEQGPMLPADQQADRGGGYDEGGGYGGGTGSGEVALGPPGAVLTLPEDFHCKIGSTDYYLRHSTPLEPQPHGALYGKGTIWGPQDRNCLFEMDIDQRTYCVGPEGLVHENHSRGRVTGQCYKCGATGCTDWQEQVRRQGMR